MHLFETVLSLPTEDLEFELRGYTQIPWADFLLNPRRLRGSDFLMRWSQGVWSEERLVQAVADTKKYFALPYGPSGVAPDHDVREFELYFERLEAAGLGSLKRPDLLIFQCSNNAQIEAIVEILGGVQNLPFTPEEDPSMKSLLSQAIFAVECENSLWRAKLMPDYGEVLKPQKRLQNQLGLKKSAVLPTIILKEEDRKPLLDWQEKHGVGIHIWHSFFDLAYGLPLDAAMELLASGKIIGTEQVFQAPGGATTKKLIYKFYYHYAYPLAVASEEPKLIAESITDKNGHILPYVRFEGGKLVLLPEALSVLDGLAEKK